MTRNIHVVFTIGRGSYTLSSTMSSAFPPFHGFLGHHPWCSCAMCRTTQRDDALHADVEEAVVAPLPSLDVAAVTVNAPLPPMPNVACTCLDGHAHYVYLLHETIACMVIDETCSRENVINAVDELRDALMRTHCRHGNACAWDTGLLRRVDTAAALLSESVFDDVDAPDAQHSVVTNNDVAIDPRTNTPPMLFCDLWDDGDDASDDAAAQAPRQA